jgi:hypothetical protein
MEKAGLPAVTLVAPEFKALALSKRTSLGLPDFEPVFVPYDHAPIHYGRTPEEVRERASTVYDQIVGILTGSPQLRTVA